MKQIILFAVLFVSHAVQCDAFNCKTSGFTCSDCNTVVMCTALGNGKWKIDELDKCSTGDNLTCRNGACTNKPNPDCPKIAHSPIYNSISIHNTNILHAPTVSGSGTCDTSGITCSGCDKVVMCTSTGSGNWHIQEMDTCNIGDKESCIDGECSKKPNIGCGIEPEVKFPCMATGMFPDPFDCQYYHICCKQGEQSIGHSCEKGYMYDPSTTFCSKPYPPTGCPPHLLVPTCQTRGQTGAVPGTRSMYFMCVGVLNARGASIYYPKIFVCPFGKSFNGQACM